MTVASSPRLQFNPQAASIMVTTAGAASQACGRVSELWLLAGACWRPPTVPCHTGFSGLAIYVIKASEERLYS